MRNLRGRKVVVAMSGGVDSSVAAALLRDAGAQVVGCFMRLGSEEEIQHSGCDIQNSDGAEQQPSVRRPRADRVVNREPQASPFPRGCCSLNDAADARLVAAMLDVPFYVLNFRDDFGRIIDYFVAEYNAGRTPNPCVRCNDWLKFGKLDAYARSIDADFVASGHYARIEHGPDGPRLLRAIDAAKDQSYVLFGATRQRLQRMLLPIGGLRKREVRDIAARLGLPVFDKPDSQEICFVPGDDYAQVIRRRDPQALRPGVIVDCQGRVVGEHPGQQHFTIGQRRGVGVALGYPIYVVGRDAARNAVTVGPREALLCAGLRARQCNWLVDPPLEPLRCEVRIRYNGAAATASARAVDGDGMEVLFDQPQAAVSPGQAVVCYQADRVLGGGWITQALRAGN